MPLIALLNSVCCAFVAQLGCYYTFNKEAFVISGFDPNQFFVKAELFYQWSFLTRAINCTSKVPEAFHYSVMQCVPKVMQPEV